MSAHGLTMRLCDILTIDRIIVDADGTLIPNKEDCA